MYTKQQSSFPRILFSAINGGSGKTLVTTGILAALTCRGLKIQAFKKGPDYIDAKWLALASGRACYNLDIHMFEEEVSRQFQDHAQNADISIIEGNHGLYDSIDIEGKGSSAYLARYLQMPVVLIVNCKMMSRSIAALINGFTSFESDTNIAGIILNNVSGKRHEDRLKEAIDIYCKLPVVGVIYKSEKKLLEERHIGLVPAEEKNESGKIIRELQEIVEQGIDLDMVLQIAHEAPPLDANVSPKKNNKPGVVSIGVARDEAFNFYYPDNLAALEQEGAELIYFSPINDEHLPVTEALYFGGGYPEIFAAELERNASMRSQIREAIEKGMPTFAECGGMMYMTKGIQWKNQSHEMIGALPCICKMTDKPQGRGYATLESAELPPEINTFWKIKSGLQIRAHEFHFSVLEDL
ncbi:MAG: cobyrinate a,c-diamide synthase, partial [Spirochaetia bacterium]|nr:cobyrinate a,c-diamide synthase [Spirochaetia bacterium]